jgi:hypothetical protein
MCIIYKFKNVKEHNGTKIMNKNDNNFIFIIIILFECSYLVIFLY